MEEFQEVKKDQKKPLLQKSSSLPECNTYTSKSISCEEYNLPDSSILPIYCKSNNINKPYESSLIIDTAVYDEVVQKLRSFFVSRGFLEVSTQNRLSILAACEDPFNVGVFNYAGSCWPLPQTGQMWLEYEILKNPKPEGYFCLTTSYRMEKNPKEGRHDLIFPLFKFEMKGGMDALIELEKKLLIHLGYNSDSFIEESYENIAKLYNVKELDHEHEERLYNELSPTFFIKDFPEFTSPFWNMSRYEDGFYSKKIDVILGGMETIGSAERSTNVDQMRDTFHTITDGAYANLLFDLFGKDRVEAELEEFLQFDFFPRVGGGIGMTRMISALDTQLSLAA